MKWILKYEIGLNTGARSFFAQEFSCEKQESRRREFFFCPQALPTHTKPLMGQISSRPQFRVILDSDLSIWDTSVDHVVVIRQSSYPSMDKIFLRFLQKYPHYCWPAQSPLHPTPYTSAPLVVALIGMRTDTCISFSATRGFEGGVRFWMMSESDSGFCGKFWWLVMIYYCASKSGNTTAYIDSADNHFLSRNKNLIGFAQTPRLISVRIRNPGGGLPRGYANA